MQQSVSMKLNNIFLKNDVNINRVPSKAFMGMRKEYELDAVVEKGRDDEWGVFQAKFDEYWDRRSTQLRIVQEEKKKREREEREQEREKIKEMQTSTFLGNHRSRLRPLQAHFRDFEPHRLGDDKKRAKKASQRNYDWSSNNDDTYKGAFFSSKNYFTSNDYQADSRGHKFMSRVASEPIIGAAGTKQFRSRKADRGEGMAACLVDSVVVEKRFMTPGGRVSNVLKAKKKEKELEEFFSPISRMTTTSATVKLEPLPGPASSIQNVKLPSYANASALPEPDRTPIKGPPVTSKIGIHEQIPRGRRNLENYYDGGIGFIK